MIKIKLFLGFLSFLFLPCFSQVGINTSIPDAALDINGNLKIRTTDVVSIGSANTVPLVIDNSTHEVKIVQTSTGSTFSMNYTTYHLNNTNGDWVNNYDTKISTADYTLVIVGCSFDRGLIIDFQDGYYSPMNVFAFQDNGTWRINADYLNVTTFDNVNGNWHINCLIISNNIVKVLPAVGIDMYGSHNGSAGSPPAGL